MSTEMNNPYKNQDMNTEMDELHQKENVDIMKGLTDKTYQNEDKDNTNIETDEPSNDNNVDNLNTETDAVQLLLNEILEIIIRQVLKMSQRPG